MKEFKRLKVLSAIVIFVLMICGISLIVSSSRGLGFYKNKASSGNFKQSKLFDIETEQSKGIEIGKEFSQKYILNLEGKAFGYVAIAVEYDSNYLTLNEFTTNRPDIFKERKGEDYRIVVPKIFSSTFDLKDINPELCYSSRSKQCFFTENVITGDRIEFELRAKLNQIVSEFQRPLKFTMYGIRKDGTVSFWDFYEDMPKLQLVSDIKNSRPEFKSIPIVRANVGEFYEYALEATDLDGDPLTFSLDCPKYMYCRNKPIKYQNGIKLVDNTKLVWDNIPGSFAGKTIPIRIFLTDGKDVVEQNFNLNVRFGQISFVNCSFIPSYGGDAIIHSRSTAMILSIDSEIGIKNVDVTFVKDDKEVKSLNYIFKHNPTRLIIDENSTPALVFNFEEGSYKVSAKIKDSLGKEYVCPLTPQRKKDSGGDSKVKSKLELESRSVLSGWFRNFMSVRAEDSIVTASNYAPVIETDPNKNDVNNIKLGDTYLYEMRIRDPENKVNDIAYTIVRKPSWATVSKEIRNDLVYLTIAGTPASTGSHTFSISVTDGIDWTTQTWIVNVGDRKNSPPNLKITEPTTKATYYQGTIFKLEWNATDKQHIKGFKLYYTKDVSDKSKWKKITELAYNVKSYGVDTSEIPIGKYYFVVTAEDSYVPPATARANTPLIYIVEKPKEGGKDGNGEVPDERPSDLDYLLIEVISPKEASTIEAKDFELLAKVYSSTGGKLKSSNVKLFLDAKEVSSGITFSSSSEVESLSLSFKSNELLSEGTHVIKLEAEDSRKIRGSKSISFNIKDKTINSGGSVEQGDKERELFGFRIPEKIYWIVVGALGFLLIIFILPLILHLLSKEDDDTKYSSYTVNSNTSPPAPSPQSNETTYNYAPAGGPATSYSNVNSVSYDSNGSNPPYIEYVNTTPPFNNIADESQNLNVQSSTVPFNSEAPTYKGGSSNSLSPQTPVNL